jgi:hypothetical protein
MCSASALPFPRVIVIHPFQHGVFGVNYSSGR